MKKLYTFFAALFFAVTATAQLQTEVVSAGVFKITYGAANDYSIYEPGFEVPTFYVHCWISAAENTSGSGFSDAWSNSTVTMNWDSAAMAYVGTIDLNTKTFTDTNTKVPAGTTVNKVGMVFKDLQSGATKQSADLEAVGPTTIVTLGVSAANVSAKSTFVRGNLYPTQKGQLEIFVYEMGGKLMKTVKTVADGGALNLGISKSGIYLVRISSAAGTEVLKIKN